MEDLIRECSRLDIDEALYRIKHQLDNGYVDIGGIMDDVELAVVRTAIELFEEKLEEKEND